MLVKAFPDLNGRREFCDRCPTSLVSKSRDDFAPARSTNREAGPISRPQQGEVDVLRLRVLPLLLVRGRSFAPSDLGLRRLSLATAQSFAGGLVVLEYDVAP